MSVVPPVVRTNMATATNTVPAGSLLQRGSGTEAAMSAAKAGALEARVALLEERLAKFEAAAPVLPSERGSVPTAGTTPRHPPSASLFDNV